jgi:exonuclease III
MLEEKVDVIAVQETHTASAESLRRRGNLTGFTLVSAVYSSSMELLRTSGQIYQDHTNNVHVLAVELDAIIIVNVYKPSSTSWSSNPLKIFPHPAIYDFNSHNQQWGYDHNDVDGNLIHECMTLNSLHLIYHPKDKGTFRSAR